MKNLTLVLDPAHGVDVAGKRSPDGSFREYKWSREIVGALKASLEQAGVTVYVTVPEETEPGLTTRVHRTDAFPGANKLFISIHSNAAGNGSQWMSARGFAVYTSEGQTQSDVYANQLYNTIQQNFPEFNGVRNFWRSDTTDGEKDYDAKFSVLYCQCPAMLIEWGFQDNREDCAMLLDEGYNERLVAALTVAILELQQ